MYELTFYRSVFSPGDFFAESEMKEICISGRSNVGKSSLLNRLANRKHLARTSRKPGKTRSINYYRIGDSSRFLVDLPGYGYAKVPMTERKLFGELVNPYLRERRQLVGIIQLLDARHGPVSGDHLMLDFLDTGFDGNVLYVFTKEDKLSAREKVLLKKRIAQEFGMENSVLFSALTRTGIESIWLWIERALGTGDNGGKIQLNTARYS